MRVALLNTGTELLLGDVQDAHLGFIARKILLLDLRIAEQRAVPDDAQAIRRALDDLFARTDILFVTGGLGPTTDDLTCQVVAESLGLKLKRNEKLLASLQNRFKERRFKWTERVARQADVPAGAQILANDNGSAPGFYLRANINPEIHSPHVFILPGPPRELQPMFRTLVISILRDIVGRRRTIARRLYKITGITESLVEEAIGEQVLAIPNVELGYCARPGEVDVRILGERDGIRRADEIIRENLGQWIFATDGETLEHVLVMLLSTQKQTLAVAESCTGGLLAHRITNVPGASEVFLVGYVTYANEAKTNIVAVGAELLENHGAVSEPVARAMAEGARARARSTYALSTTGIAGPGGGSREKPVGTVYVGLASANDDTVVKKFFFPTDRETFKHLTTQVALDLLRCRLVRT